MSLLGEILALPEELRQSQDTQAIADALSVGRVKLVPTEIGAGTVLMVLGIEDGNALLDVINSVSDFRHVKPLVEQGRLRIDMPLVRATLDSLVPLVLTTEQADALKAVAEIPDPVDEMEVRRLCWSNEGSWQV